MSLQPPPQVMPMVETYLFLISRGDRQKLRKPTCDAWRMRLNTSSSLARTRWTGCLSWMKTNRRSMAAKGNLRRRRSGYMTLHIRERSQLHDTSVLSLFCRATGTIHSNCRGCSRKSWTDRKPGWKNRCLWVRKAAFQEHLLNI